MAKFHHTEVNRLIVELGYSSCPDLARYQLESDFETDALVTVMELLTILDDIDAKLIAALGKSRIAEVDGIKFTPGLNVSHLKSEGNRILNTISGLVGVPVRHNKYHSGKRVSVRSYW